LILILVIKTELGYPIVIQDSYSNISAFIVVVFYVKCME